MEFVLPFCYLSRAFFIYNEATKPCIRKGGWGFLRDGSSHSIMETDIIQTVARYAEETMGHEGFRCVSAVVANCKMLALEMEALEENPVTLDPEALVIAAYLHDISTVMHGYQNHHVKSAQMA